MLRLDNRHARGAIGSASGLRFVLDVFGVCICRSTGLQTVAALRTSAESTDKRLQTYLDVDKRCYRPDFASGDGELTLILHIGSDLLIESGSEAIPGIPDLDIEKLILGFAVLRSSA